MNTITPEAERYLGTACGHRALRRAIETAKVYPGRWPLHYDVVIFGDILAGRIAARPDNPYCPWDSSGIQNKGWFGWQDQDTAIAVAVICWWNGWVGNPAYFKAKDITRIKAA